MSLLEKYRKIYGGEFMGLFDSIKKFGENIGKEIEKSVGQDAFKNIKDAVTNNANASNNQHSSQNTKEIPAEYSEFPKFREVVTDLSTKETNQYRRCTMNFENVTEQEVSEYVTKINSLGFVRGSKVRFDKGNTYIIVDNQYGDLNLVFHIKR